MTRTDVAASSRPRNAGATSLRRGSSRACRRLSVVPIVLLLAAALLVPQAASAAESTSGYSQTTPTPKTTPTTPTTPTTGTSPSKEEKTTPEKTTKETSPTSSTPTSTTSTSKEKATTLPFTGFDLRWSVGIGVLLIASGFSLVMVDRRRRRASR